MPRLGRDAVQDAGRRPEPEDARLGDRGDWLPLFPAQPDERRHWWEFEVFNGYESAASMLAVELFMMQQEWGRPFVMPPEVPADRLAAMRAAFDGAMKDPICLGEAEKLCIDIDPMTGAEIDKMFKDAYATPSEVVERTKVLLKRAGTI